MTIEAGDVTTSDHIPIIVIISTSFIIKETKTIKDYNNTNWETFQEKLTDNTNVQRQSIPLAGRVTIDEAITKWMTDIQDTMNDTIPYKTINEHISPTWSTYVIGRQSSEGRQTTPTAPTQLSKWEQTTRARSC